MTWNKEWQRRACAVCASLAAGRLWRGEEGGKTRTWTREAREIFVVVDVFLHMSHHLFILSPSDTPIYSLAHYSSRPAATVTSPLAASLPIWSTSAFAGTLTALSGASSAMQHSGSGTRMGGGQDRHVIQMIANASLDVIEDVVRKENPMCVCVFRAARG